MAPIEKDGCLFIFANMVEINKLDKKIRVGAVSYLNTKPLIYGFEKGMMLDTVDLQLDYPSKIAAMLLDGSIDIGLVPVAIIPEMKTSFIESEFCIASDGAVSSVCLFSEVPVEEIKTVLLDYQSRTSVMMVQYLLKEYWKINPVYINASANYITEIKGSVAALIIGDRAFKQKSISKFHYDLGLAWKLHTGLPFVYAAWVSNKPMTPEFNVSFSNVNRFGLEHIAEVIKLNKTEQVDLENYFAKNILYQLDETKIKGLNLFLDICSKANIPKLLEA